MSDDLVIAKASWQAAKYAVDHWHYSKSLPVGKCFIRGVWEKGKFVGVIVFSRPVGVTIGMGFTRDFGLVVTEYVELNRVALDHSHVTPVSKIVSKAIRDLRASNPGLRLIVSFADPRQGHHGGIYQAGNWIYTGRSNATTHYFLRGRIMHPKQISSMRWKASESWLRKNVDPNCHKVSMPGKHRYYYPLDKGMRRTIERLRMPYPSAAEVSTVIRTGSTSEG